MKAWLEMKYGWVFFWSGFGLLAERFWNAFWPALSVVALYIAAACFNILSLFGPTAHLLMLFLFVAGFSLAATRLGAHFKFPRTREIRRAIELESALRHRPLEALLDRPVEGTAPASRALWNSYQERVARLKERLKTYRPKPDAARRDPYSLRIGAALLMVVSLVVAQHDAWYRIRQGLYVDVTKWVHATPVALDAWIVPPDYTRQNPVFLATTQLGAAAVRGSINVPEGSVLKVRLAGYDAPPGVTYAGAPTPAFTEPAPHNFTMEMPLTKNGELKIKKGWFRTLGKWQVWVTPDMPPEITLLGTEKADRATLKIKYKVADDYGIHKVYGVIAPTDELRKTVGDRTIDFDIPVPDDLHKDEQVYVADLASHPWAGAEVMLSLNAVDAADHEATSVPKKITLPERDFTNPTAQRIIAERKRLIWYDNLITERLVITALTDIANSPQNYKFDPLVFLGLDMAAKRLSFDGGPEAVQSDIAFLWDLAVRVEDGGLSLAARELSDALQRLSEGLKDKSLSKDQIQALMDDVQQKMREYVKTLAQEMQQRMQEGKQNPQLSQELADKLMKKVDMGKLMEQMRQLSQGSEREQMEKMAQFLKNSVDKFDPSKLDKMQEAQKKAMDALNKLQKLIERQQSLLDKTNKMQQKQQPQQDQQQDQQQQQQQGNQGQEQQQGDQGQGDQQDQQQQSGGQNGQQSQQQSGGQQGQGSQGGQQGQQSQQPGGGGIPQLMPGGAGMGQQQQQSGQGEKQGQQAAQGGQQSQQQMQVPGGKQGQQPQAGGHDKSFPPQPNAGGEEQQQQEQGGGQQQGQEQQGGDKGQQQSQSGQQGQGQQPGGQQQSQSGQQVQGQQPGGQQQSQSGQQGQGQQPGEQQQSQSGQQGRGQQPGGQQQSQSGQQGQGQQPGGQGQQSGGQQQTGAGGDQGPQQAQGGGGNEGKQQQAGGGDSKEKFPEVKTPKDGATEQGNIRGKLGDIMRDLGSGMSNLPEQFGKADQSMKAAQNALKDGDARGSAPSQREALENLQKAEDAALEQMAKSLQTMLSMGFMPSGNGGGDGYGDGFDPLGRDQDNNGKATGNIKIPDEKERRRVQQIIEELRSRSNDYQRPKIERDYIDRLLEQFD